MPQKDKGGKRKKEQSKASQDRKQNSQPKSKLKKAQKQAADEALFPLLEASVVSCVFIPFNKAGNSLQRVLDTWGFAVVTGVISPSECQELERLFEADLRDAALLLNGVYNREKVKSTDKVLFAWPQDQSLANGIFATNLGLPQGRFAWRVRQNERIRSLYSLLHPAEGTGAQLCVGLDNPFFTPKQAKAKSRTDGLWPHVDQNSHWQGFSGHCHIYQSALYVWSAERDGDSTTVIWPKSHSFAHQAMMADERAPFYGHYFEIRDMGDQKTSEGLLEGFLQGARRIPVPAGALLMWNSKTVHQGHAGGPRLAMPVCWEPVARRSEQARLRKACLIVAGLPSTHWASLGYFHECAQAWLSKPAIHTAAGAVLEAQSALAAQLRETIRKDFRNYLTAVEPEPTLCKQVLQCLTKECLEVGMGAKRKARVMPALKFSLTSWLCQSFKILMGNFTWPNDPTFNVPFSVSILRYENLNMPFESPCFEVSNAAYRERRKKSWPPV
eukprot:g80244.t1